MKKSASLITAAIVGTLLSLAGTSALAHGRDHDRGGWEQRHHDHGWKHGHDRYYYERGPVVYAPAYYAPPPPPPVVYQPAYYGYRPAAPAITIGVGIPPIVIPLR